MNKRCAHVCKHAKGSIALGCSLVQAPAICAHQIRNAETTTSRLAVERMDQDTLLGTKSTSLDLLLWFPRSSILKNVLPTSYKDVTCFATLQHKVIPQRQSETKCKALLCTNVWTHGTAQHLHITYTVVPMHDTLENTVC
eukprot:3216552-Amphidinium_carterae.2